MASLKVQLKLAREAISAKDWGRAESCAGVAVESDGTSYHGYVFLGLARFNLKKVSESEKAYRSAIAIDPLQPLAWKGLISLYEETQDLNKLIDSLERLMHIWNDNRKAWGFDSKIDLTSR